MQDGHNFMYNSNYYELEILVGFNLEVMKADCQTAKFSGYTIDLSNS